MVIRYLLLLDRQDEKDIYLIMVVNLYTELVGLYSILNFVYMGRRAHPIVGRSRASTAWTIILAISFPHRGITSFITFSESEEHYENTRERGGY